MAFEIGNFAANLSSMRQRTIEVVTEEAREAKAQITPGFLDLGARLNEAKEMLQHGEWLPWLEREMQFSERTAQKFMALAREYEGNPQLASDLGSEKAFALLALPKEEREEIAANGATVNGKTKAPADLTTRDVKQIEAERKQGYDPRADAQAYLDARAEEDAEYRDLLQRQKLDLTPYLAYSPTRQDGIAALKRQLSSHGGYDGEVYYRGSGTGWELHQLRGNYIKRSWTELWDMLAVMALQEAGRKAHEAEAIGGQLAIAGYMPGGTNPGTESGLCVCMMQLDPEKEPAPMLLYWDGAKCEWQFKHGAAVEEEPVGWMRLPEWR